MIRLDETILVEYQKKWPTLFAFILGNIHLRTKRPDIGLCVGGRALFMSMAQLAARFLPSSVECVESEINIFLFKKKIFLIFFHGTQRPQAQTWAPTWPRGNWNFRGEEKVGNSFSKWKKRLNEESCLDVFQLRRLLLRWKSHRARRAPSSFGGGQHLNYSHYSHQHLIIIQKTTPRRPRWISLRSPVEFLDVVLLFLLLSDVARSIRWTSWYAISIIVN